MPFAAGLIRPSPRRTDPGNNLVAGFLPGSPSGFPMKKTLLLIAVLSTAAFSFASADKTAADKAKCDDASAKCCCKCCCGKDAKACVDPKDSKATCAKDAKPASAPVTH